MSIASEISRISGNVSDALDAIEAKGVTIPSGANSDDLATLIGQISSGGTGAVSVVDTQDSHGGIIRTITGVDISDTTAVAADVAQGKYFYTAAGQKTAGTASGGGPTPTPEPWVRPSDWPDLSKMDVSAGNIIYMTSYADENRGFCDFYVNCTGSYTVEIGTISGTTFTADSTQTYTSGSYCQLYYGSANGTFKVLRVTGTSITRLYFRNAATITIGAFYGYNSNQGIIDIVGKLPSCDYLYIYGQKNVINVEVSDLVLSGSQASRLGNCRALVSLDVSSWNTSAVTNMSSMFSYCQSLTSLDVSSWDTSKVTDMGYMFQYCNSLTSLDVSDWDTSKVTNMNSMFQNCYSLTSLDVSSWDTGKVANMQNVFYGCFSLTSIDVSRWHTGAATNMASMFYNCCSVPLLDVSNWDTSKVTNMASMFYNCYSLAYLDVSDWDTGAVTGMSGVFTNCYSLAALDVSGWDTSKVTNMANMFSSCEILAALDVSGWDFSLITTATSIQNVFRYCYGLHTLTLPSTMTMIGNYCFDSTYSMYDWHFLSTTPPTLNSTNAFDNMTDFGGKKIYVPAASLSAYQTANNWSTYASYMVGE